MKNDGHQYCYIHVKLNDDVDNCDQSFSSAMNSLQNFYRMNGYKYIHGIFHYLPSLSDDMYKKLN